MLALALRQAILLDLSPALLRNNNCLMIRDVTSEESVVDATELISVESRNPFWAALASPSLFIISGWRWLTVVLHQQYKHLQLHLERIKSSMLLLRLISSCWGSTRSSLGYDYVYWSCCFERNWRPAKKNPSPARRPGVVDVIGAAGGPSQGGFPRRPQNGVQENLITVLGQRPFGPSMSSPPRFGHPRFIQIWARQR